MNRNIAIILIAGSVAAVVFAITRSQLDAFILGASCFVVDAVLRLGRSTKVTVKRKNDHLRSSHDA